MPARHGRPCVRRARRAEVRRFRDLVSILTRYAPRGWLIVIDDNVRARRFPFLRQLSTAWRVVCLPNPHRGTGIGQSGQADRGNPDWPRMGLPKHLLRIRAQAGYRRAGHLVTGSLRAKVPDPVMAEGLKAVLRADKDAFAQCVASKLLMYALGRREFQAKNSDTSDTKVRPVRRSTSPRSWRSIAPREPSPTRQSPASPQTTTTWMLGRTANKPLGMALISDIEDSLPLRDQLATAPAERLEKRPRRSNAGPASQSPISDRDPHTDPHTLAA